MNSSRFSGRVAVIAGGASGAGRAVAKRISAEGGLVAIWDNNQAAISALEQEFRPAMTLKVDVTDPAAVANAASQTFERLGRLDMLMCSAGVTGVTAPVSD